MFPSNVAVPAWPKGDLRRHREGSVEGGRIYFCKVPKSSWMITGAVCVLQTMFNEEL